MVDPSDLDVQAGRKSECETRPPPMPLQDHITPQTPDRRSPCYYLRRSTVTERISSLVKFEPNVLLGGQRCWG